ncbi:MAG: peptidoglycan-binding domain-containing protein [Patescibacteria group bacterium]
MLKKMFLSLLLVVAVSTYTPAAHAQDMDGALERMDEIIAEMQALRAEFAQLAGSVSAQPAGQVQGAQTSSIGFTESLEVGETNDDIAWIQKLLATDEAIYPDGIVSGFYGPKTVEAIRNLQNRFGLDPVGVIGPATQTILEAFLAAFPTGAFPDDVLAQVPQAPTTPQPVATASTPAQSTTPAPSTSSQTETSSNNPLRYVEVEIDDEEAVAEVKYNSGLNRGIIVDSEDEDEIIEEIADRLSVAERYVRDVISFEDSDRRSSSDADEDDAEDALDDAEDAIDAADDEIDEAEEDGEDVDEAKDLLDDAEDALEEAEEAYDDEDYEEAVEKAEEAEELAKDAEDAIGEDSGSSNSKGDKDEIDEIEVEVDEDEADVTVKYEDDNDYEFEIETDDEDDMIEEIADELNLDEDEVEDLIDWDWGDMVEIDVSVETQYARVTVEYDSGAERKFNIDAEDEDDEDEMIEEIADRIDEDEEDVEDIADFDYED